jgi:hypothetical protein
MTTRSATEAPVQRAKPRGNQRGYTITFKVTRLADGRIQAAHKVRLGYHDDLGTQVLDTEYSGRIVGSADEFTMLERHLARFVCREFDMIPRPVTVRVVYEGEGLDPAGPGETSLVVDHCPRAERITTERTPDDRRTPDTTRVGNDAVDGG